MPRPPAVSTLRFDLDEAGALDRLQEWAGRPLPVSASVWHRGRLYIRLGGALAAVSMARRLMGGTEVESAEASGLWSDVRDHRHEFFDTPSMPLAQGERLWRVSVSSTAPPLALPGESLLEWGGALRWLRGSATAAEVRSAASRRGGHATLFRSADKSDGAFTPVSAPLMQIHRRLKHSFDPAGIFNPGRLYPEL
jgi:hypothetical protein